MSNNSPKLTYKPRLEPIPIQDSEGYISELWIESVAHTFGVNVQQVRNLLKNSNKLR
jgi:NADH:ubiquinone oxidoreductase subunit E